MENKNIEILENLIVYKPVNKKIRLGREGDGGYVIIDGYNYDCFISAGIANEMSFEIDFIKKYPNIYSLAFDGTIKSPDLPKEINFFKINIGSDNTNNVTNLKEYVKDYNDVFIKMDIEGGEWDWIKGFRDFFPKIKQIVFEAHNKFSSHVTWTSYTSVLESLQILNETHYLVHIHENNHGSFENIKNKNYPNFSELTFIRKEIRGFNTDNLPIKNLDFPTCSTMPTNDINFWPFVFPKTK